MTHFNNLITMTNVMRHNSLTAVNPDGQPTVNRQSKLTSYRGWCKKLTMILAVLVLSIGNAWGDTELFSTDFSSATWSSATFSQGNTTTADVINGITFYSKNSTKQFSISDGELSFPDNNIASSNYFLAIPVTGVNGSITVTITNTVSSSSAWNVKYVVKQETSVSTPGSTGTASTSGKTTTTFTVSGLTKSDYVVYIGRSSSNNEYKKIKTISITTPAPSCTSISPSLSYESASLMVGDNSSAPTLNKDGSAGAVTWTSSDEDVARVNSSGVVTAVGAGSATITATIAANGGKCEGTATANFTVTADPLGSHTLTWNLTVRESSKDESTLGTATTDIGTASTASTSTYLTSLTDLTGVGVKRTTNGKSNNTGKIETPSSYDADKYVTMTFAVASGYQFTPSSVSIKTVAVSTAKDLKFEFSDANGSYSVTKTSLSTSGTAATNTLDFSGCDKAFTGTVTVKIYVYGATDQYRLSTPLTIDGTVAAAVTPSCEAPSSVGISGEWRYFPGQTISLTATPTGHTGTPTYQWQKEISADNWQNISNGTEAGVTISGATTNNLQITPCGTGNTGKYRCSVSTGATCSKTSDPFSVKIFTLNGAYDDGEFTSNNITFTSGTTGTATVHLAAGRVYKFKVTDNFGMWFGNSGRILEPAVNWTFPSDNSTNCVLFTGPEGDYTFTVDINHVTYGTPEVVVSVAYPDVTHPSAGYAYFKNVDNWTNVGLYMWYEGGGSYTDWGSEPWVTRTTTICGNTYYYTPLIPSWYNRAIFREVGGSGQTDNIEYANLAAYSGKYNDKSDANWHEFTTYTISFNAGGGTGTMDAIAGICPNSNQEITANAFEKTGHTFNCWHADVATKVGGSAVAIGGDIAGGATLQEINNNITLTAQWTPIPVSSISVAPSSKTLEVGGTQQLTATVSPDNAFDRTVTWSTSNGSVATVSSTGLVTAVAAGTCTITATANDGSGKTGTCSITVEAAAAACYTFTPATSGSAPSKGDVINGTGSGGTMVAGTGQSYTANGLKFESSGDYRYVTVTLDNNLKEGSVIAVTMWMDGTSSNRGLYLQTSAGTQKAEWKFTADSENHQFSYTVEAGDGLINTNVFRLARINNVYLKSVTVSNCGDAVCTTPTTAFANGAYTVGGSALDLSTLISSKQGSGAITYTVKNANGTGATIAGTSFTATSAGTATVTATQAADATYCEKVMDATITVSAGGGCTQQSVVKTVLSSTTAGTTTGYNNDEYAGDPTIVTFEGNPVNGGYKLKSNSKLFVTLKKGSFVAGDKINIVITKASDVNASTTGKLLIFYNASSPALLSTIDAASAGTYTYTLTTSDITTLGSNKTIGVFRSSGTTENNPYVKSVEVEGCRDWTVDETAPTFVSSVPANGATGVATSGTIVLTFSEALGSVDESKFTLTGATKGAVSIDGSDATKVNIAYSGAANSATVTLATAAAAVRDVAGNALAEALSNISFTTAAAAPAGDCITIAYFETTSHSNSSSKPDNAGKYIYGYTNSAKTEAYAYTITSSTGDNKGQGTGESDYLRMNYGTTVTIYADNTTTGGTPASFSNVTSVSVDFKMKNSSYYTTFDIYVGGTKIANNVSLEGAAQSAFTTFTYDNLEQLSGTVRIVNKGSGSSNYHFYVDNIQICTSSLPACTTPVLPTLTAKTVCEGGDADAAWNATITNSGSLVSGETVAYSWVKKGSSTVLSSTATYQPTSVTESMAGTYVVTATVSAEDKASATATKEVTLTVNEATEVTAITADKATVYPGNSVTLTATANMDATWKWYTCTNAEGAGESSTSVATSASYTIASAGAAGTYYYKAKATGSCGTAERVYTLTVTAASECQNYYWFIYADDATANGVINNRDGFFSNTTTGTGNTGTYTMTVDGTSMTGTKRLSTGAYKPKFTVPDGATATLYIYGKAASSDAGKHLVLKRTSDDAEVEVTSNTTVQGYTKEGIESGEWTLSCGSSNWCYSFFAVKVCAASTCTDATPTITAANTTVCVGSELNITATGYETSPESIQWQKLNGSAWDNISGAMAATYTIASATAADAGSYRVVVTKGCARTSNTVTIAVPSTPVFGSLGGAREVETGGSLSITNVEASDATSYKWYRSSNNTYEVGTDEQVGTAKNLLLPVNDAAGTTFYLFCVATNTCGNVTSDAITVSVIAAAEKDCAVGTSNGDNFTTAKTSDVNGGSYLGQTELHMSSNNKYIYYTAADGYHFQTATVNCCAGDATALTKAAYGYSTDGGANWTDADLPGAMTNQYSDHVVNLPANVNAFRVGRVLNGKGVGSNTLYVHQVCFTYVADCNATTITVSNASPTYDLAAGSDFTEPTCTVKQGSTALSPQPALRYSSFNEAVATVDPSTGEVDFTGTAGSVVIMASYDGDEDYCASSATYTITVSCGSESAPKIVAGSGTNLSGCNASVSLAAKDQSGNNFASGSYQWYRDGEEIDGATSATYTAERTGTYTVSHTGECTQMSTNSAVVTSESFDPSVERLVPFQYYHADKTYTAQMKDRHLFAVTSGGDYEGKRYHMTATRNGDPLDISASTAFFVRTSRDNRVDTVMIDLNELKTKFSAGDEIVLTCAAIADCGTISAVTENIELHVIDDTPTLALICSGTNKSAGTRKTSELTVGGDFLTGYNKADLCVQTGNTSFDGSTEWGLYTKLKEHYLVTPVNGYAVFNKLNYEPFDICFLTDYPKSSKSPEAATVLDDMADLCDYRPLFSFKTHMVAKQPSQWAAKGFTTTAEVPKQSRLRLNITCYAHPMFKDIKGSDVARDYDDGSQIVYTMLTGAGYESSKGMQGFHLAAAENFVTIGLVHYNATATDDYEGSGNVKWTPGSGDEMLVAAAERQENIEARMIFFSLNCGAQSKLTAQGETVVLKCLEYLLNDATIEGNLSDCSLTFDNKAGDGNWNTPGNWGPDHVTVPGQYNAARIAAPATVDIPHAKALELRIMDGGSVTIPAGSGLEIKSTIRHLDGKTVSPTEVSDLHIGSGASGNGTLIFNNNSGDTKAQVDMYSKGKTVDGTKNYQYIGTPFNEINALYNYYGARIYSWNGSGWTNVKNGGPMTAWTGYCISSSSTSDEYYQTSGTLTATTTKDITVPAGANMVIGNSWTAPIDIKSFTNDDFENLTGNVYFFNTGVDVAGTGTVTENATGTTRWTAGTYVSVPIHAASYTGTDDHIPSLQGFFVTSSGFEGTLHLDYDKHVRGTTRGSILSGEMHAPARRAAVSSNEPAVLKIKVSGEKYDDKLLLLEREDFTTGKDFGWDGDKWDGNESALYLYTTDNNGTENSVSAVPELEGTIIGFRAGEDDAYTLNFEYLNSDEPLYLYDSENSTYTRIMTGVTYRFFTTDKSKHARFIITRKSPQIATGVGEVPSDEVRSTKAKKLFLDNKLFILRNGMLYDATGKVVK